MKKTKIVCTLGPATDSSEIMEALLTAGMNIARFNFSHGDYEGHKKRMDAIRAASAKTGIPVAIVLDTKGPEIRLGAFRDGYANLEEGQHLILTTDEMFGDQHKVSVSYKNLAKEVTVGDHILLADGLVSLKVQAINNNEIDTIIENSGKMGSGKRVAVPGVTLGLPFLSEQDRADITFGIEQKVDFIAASFVQQAEDVRQIRALLDKHHSHAKIIAKIENVQSIENLAEILEEADGLMIARGDLGIEIAAEEVPLLQKKIIKMCNEVGKPVITATQMLESMVNNPRPTRAEASDVANAILDGTDAVMLSGETASGLYPIEAVTVMTSIAKKTETVLDSEYHLTRFGFNQTNTPDAISHAAVQIAMQLNVKGIISFTQSGFTAQKISRYRPRVPIFAVTPNEETIRHLQLVWGVVAVRGTEQRDTDKMTKEAIKCCLAAGYVEIGDQVEITAGVPIGQTGTTNIIQVHIVT